MLKLVFLTAASIFTAEALVMLFLEFFGSEMSLLGRTLVNATLLLVCGFLTLSLLVFKEMAELDSTTPSGRENSEFMESKS